MRNGEKRGRGVEGRGEAKSIPYREVGCTIRLIGVRPIAK
jgi:hypothetical protein